jgi:acyl-CoA thioesterase I
LVRASRDPGRCLPAARRRLFLRSSGLVDGSRELGEFFVGLAEHFVDVPQLVIDAAARASVDRRPGRLGPRWRWLRLHSVPASMLSSPGIPVTATNDAVGGYTTSDVLSQLDDPNVDSHVAKADVVELEVGANDVGYSASCGSSVSCYAPKIPTIQQNLDAIIAKVQGLTQGRHFLLVLLDYWSVWLGGQYAQAQGTAYVDAAAEVTDQVNQVIKDAAARTGAAYVDLRAAFKGPDYTYDETHYLAPDGDHPNAAGHQQIATAVVNEVGATPHS